MIGRPRERAATLLTSFPLRTVLRRIGTWRGLLVLNYHRVGDSHAEPWDHSLWSASAEQFEAQLQAAVRWTDVIDPRDTLQAIGAPRGRHLLLTFDDGYRDNYEIAFPALRSHGVRAAFFLATGFLDRPHAPWWDEIAWMANNARTSTIALGEWGEGELSLAERARPRSIATLVGRYKQLAGDACERFLQHVARTTGSGRCPPEAASELWMTWDMARELQAAGMAIGGHTVTHPILAHLPEARQREEIDACARRLRDELGLQMTSFAYPVGARDTFNETTKRLLRDHGVETAFSFHGGFATPVALDPLAVPRVHVGTDFSPKLLEATAAVPQIFARAQ